MFLNRKYVCLQMTHNFLIEMTKQLNSLLMSGSKINYEKAKELFVGRLRGKRPRFTKKSWVTDNIKALGKKFSDNKVNQIYQSVCGLDKKEGGMGIINIENLIRSKQIKIIYIIIHSDL